MPEPQVTVCIPTIPQRPEMLARARDSAISQTIPVEVLVENDVMRTGAAKTRNRLLERVQTPFIAWLDDDDELLPEHCEVLLEAIRANAADLAYPTPEIPEGRDPTATSFRGKWVLPWGIPFGWEQESHLRKHGNFIPMTHIVRTSVVRAAGGFPIPGTDEWPRPNVEDWGYLVRLLDVGAKFVHVNRKTWVWRIHSAHTGGQPDR